MGTFLNYNGKLLAEPDFKLRPSNRAFRYGDGLFESMKYSDGIVYFYEDHYFRLMGSLCMLRVDIPSKLNMEYLYEQIIETITKNDLQEQSCKLRLHVFRTGSGLYTPQELSVDYLIEVEAEQASGYVFNEAGLTSDLYFDHKKAKAILSSIKSDNALIYVLASIFAKENDLDQVFLMNTDQEIIETQNANLLIFKDNEVFSPNPEQGALDGIIRKQMLKLLEQEGFTLAQKPLRAYEVNTADQVLVCNSSFGVQYIAQFRKKHFDANQVSEWNIKLEALAKANAFSLATL
ncbi:MAG: aminotransferase class IV [Flavobacteriales bacterium]